MPLLASLKACRSSACTSLKKLLAMEDIADRFARSKALGGKRTLGEQAIKIAQSLSLPAAIGLYFLFKWHKSPKTPKAKTPAAGSAKESTSQASRKPRRDYKVNREAIEPILAQVEDGDHPELDPGDDAMEAYNEDETEAAGAAAAGGASNNQMIEMLKSMGFRMVVDKSTGQAYMVPPGQAAPGEGGPGALAEGDDEGADEDEEEEDE